MTITMNSMSSLPSLSGFPKRHYKKDSRFVNDLYTLTYDDHESLDTVQLFSVFNSENVSTNYNYNCSNINVDFFCCCYIAF